LLDGRSRLRKGKEGVAQTIEKLGYIQIDTISVVERAHNHTIWTRRPDYNQEMIQQLQANDRRIFEYWGHALSYLPMADYRYYIPRMRTYEDPVSKWDKQILKKFGHYMGPILERVRKEGPLSSKDFEHPAKTKKSTDPWDPNPTRIALNLLFFKGELMVSERRNFHRYFDIPERVLPEGTDTSVPCDDDLGRFLVYRALSSYGIARLKEIQTHIDAPEKKIIEQSLSDLVEDGKVIPININQNRNSDYYALSTIIKKASSLKRKPPQVFILSPFDNLIIQRDRTSRLFGFDYTLECYTPAAKRKYGYYVMPILWGEEFVGRLDPKADRKKKTLIIRSLLFEKGFKSSADFMSSFAGKLTDLACFNNCDKIELDRILPAKFKKPLQRLLPDTGLSD
jgi:uncharacterized protein YcaQ